MTADAIREGMSALRSSSAYDALFSSALCRARADWLIGMNMSRAFTVKYKSLLSVGRVQTPTLALLVNRQHEIEQFNPETSYGVEVDFGDYTGVYSETKKEKRFSKPEDAKAIADEAKGKTGIITESTRKEFTEMPPQLYDLTTLQREANKRFGLHSETNTKRRTISI